VTFDPAGRDADLPRARGGGAPIERVSPRPAAVARTVATVLLRPRRVARLVPEPVPHGRWLAALSMLRLAPWLVTVGIGAARLVDAGVEVAPLLPVHTVVPAPVARALSVWLLLLVPIGVPLLYFTAGLVAHLGLVLTLGARWSLSATARALAMAMLPVMLGAGLVELCAWSHAVPAAIVFGGLAAIGLLGWGLATATVAATHRVGTFHAAAVALPAVGLFLAVAAVRTALVVGTVPGWDRPPPSPYAIDTFAP